MKMNLAYFPVYIVENLKRIFKCKTYHIENAFVFIMLVLVALISHGGYVEYIGVAAVFFTFNHAGIAERLREVEDARQKHNDNKYKVECYRKLEKYFYAKEAMWLLYFVILGAWSALVGVGIFLIYQPWRSLWRK